jgi:Flp pilus assembly protein TadG
MRFQGNTHQAQRRFRTNVMQTSLTRLKTMLTASDGVAAVEFAICTPVLLLLLMGMCDLGMGISHKLQVWEAAQAGAQYALANDFNSASIQNAVTGATSWTALSATPAPTQSCGCPTGTAVAAASPAVPPCTGTCPNGAQSGSYVTVSVTAVYNPLLTYLSLGSSITLTAQSVVRIQ